MGIELSNSAARLGAQVILVTGPTHFKSDYSSVKTIPVINTKEMYEAVHKYFSSVDVAILSAAVADFRPKKISLSKIKKNSDSLSLVLEKTEDILASIGSIKEKQFLVGFALESDNEITNAIKKLKSKNLDLIILNSLKDLGAGFGVATNKITIIDKELNQIEFQLKSKAKVADDIIDEIVKRTYE